MTLPLLVYRSLRQHALSTLVTGGSIALACGLLMCVWVVKVQSQAAFTQTTTGFDAVLGARGSKLQLVLNAIFHLEASPGNLAYADYEAIKRHPAIKTAIPIAVGDNLRGYRLAGTLPELFETVEYAPGKKFALQAGGKLFSSEAKEAVVGSFAALRLGLKPGDTFRPFHGLAFDGDHADDSEITASFDARRDAQVMTMGFARQDEQLAPGCACGEEARAGIGHRLVPHDLSRVHAVGIAVGMILRE